MRAWIAVGVGLGLALAASAARAKPLTIDVDKETTESLYAFEAELLSHDESKACSRVRVTLEAAEIFRGFEQAGRELDLAWPEGGGESFRAGTLPGVRILFVVRKSGAIVVTGSPEGDSYRLMGYYDFNAVFLIVDGRRGSDVNMRDPVVSRSWLRVKTGSDPRGHAVEIARILLDPASEADSRARFDRAVAALDEEDWQARETAQSELSGPLGARFAGELADLAERADSPEVRVRARIAVSEVERLASARDLAGTYREPGRARWELLALALGARDDRLAGAVLETLRAETGLDPGTGVRAWLDALK